MVKGTFVLTWETFSAFSKKKKNDQTKAVERNAKYRRKMGND